MRMRIKIEGRPIAWKRAGVSKGRFFDRQAKERAAFQWELKKDFRKPPTSSPINLSCVFSFRIPKSLSKAKRMAFLGKPHKSRPDADNLAKWIGDCGNDVLWLDDSQIAKLSIEKIWGEEDETTIDFEEMG